MRSLKSHLFKFVIKRHFAQADLSDVATVRKQMDELGERMPLANGVRLSSVELSGIYAEWLTPENACADAVILYLHGGAYHMGSCSSHRSMASFIADAAKIPLLLIDYRLAPESPYPAALDDAETVYRWLCVQPNINTKRIFLMGDSAGGGLALALALRIKSISTLPRPAAIAVLSPWVDLTMSGESVKTRLKRDPFFAPHIQQASHCVNAYCGSTPLTNPDVSPLFGQLEGLPPLLIQVGSEEILFSDAQRLAEKAQKSGSEVLFSYWQGMWHVWQYLVPRMKESSMAIAEVGNFCRRYLK